MWHLWKTRSSHLLRRAVTADVLEAVEAAMDRAGWSEGKIRKIMGENWVRVLADVWGE